MTSLVIIPDQVGVELSVNYSGYDTFEGIDIAPVQPSPADNDPDAIIPFTKNENLYQTDAFFPEQLATSAEPVIMRDVRAVQIQLNPVQYNPVRHEMRVYRDLTVSLTYGGDVVNPKLTRTSYLSDGFYPIYKATFANFEEIFSNVEVKRGGYMIICKPTLVDSLKALALWKHKKGYSVRIVPTTEIYSSGTPTYTQIFNYIRTAYQTWADPPEYVMIVGDISGTYPVADYPYQTYPSDHHYACVDGTDFLPDLFVARLSIDNIQDFRKAVSKIFKYERTPLMRDSQHWIRGLSIGYTYYESSRLITLWVRQLMMQNGFARVDTVYGQNYDSRVMTYLNSGPGLIQYRGAGGTDGWAGPSCSVSDLNGMANNQKLGVMAILTCGTGDFSGDCLGETWIKMGYSPDSLKGGPGYYGVTDHNTHTQWNNPIMVGYYFGIFGENIYHFAAAAVRGKLQDYMAFPRHRNVEVQQYFNTYNMLGDPELELRTKIPILLNVTHPETLAFGLNHLDITVVDTSGKEVRDAFVTLIKMADTTEEFYCLGKTDESGNVSFTFNAQTEGPMMLTVSGQNLYPYEGVIQLVSRDVAVGFDSLAIDDDMLGFSYGDGDSLANPGETLELGVSLKNFGTEMAANNIIATLTSMDDESGSVLDGVRNCGNLAQGQERMMDHPFVVHISPGAQDGDIIKFKLTVTAQDSSVWISVIEIPVLAPKFVINRVAVVDINNRLDPGDTAQFIITLTNNGHKGATGVSGIISTEDDYTTIISSSGLFGDMPVDDTSSNSDNPMIVNVALGAFPGRIVHLNLQTTTLEGTRSDIPFIIKVDSTAHTYNPTGPDDYGYYIYDKTDTSFAPHPQYNWIELVPSLGGYGTRLNYGGETDDKSVLVTLPFDLVYYGQPYRSLIVCINGFVSPDTFRMDMGGNYWAYFYNWSIPDPGNCRAQISPFWDDLSYTTTPNGVYTWNDTTNHQYVIEWYHLTNNFSSSLETFEMVIYDPAYRPTITGDAEILYQYNTIFNNDSGENYATVGIENWNELTGIQYTHDNQYPAGSATISNTQALLITTNTGRGGLRGSVELTGADDHNGGAVVSSSSGQKRTTGGDGSFWLRNLPLGTVSISAQANGYFPVYRDSLEVVVNQAETLPRITLYPCPSPESLSATDNLSGVVNVNWRAVSDPRHAGYNVYRSRFGTGGFAKLNSAPIVGSNYVDNSVPDSLVYYYYVTALYSDSIWRGESFPSGLDSGRVLANGVAGEGTRLPSAFFLSQNYPNPFNPTTSISYGLPQNAHVKLEIFNIMGQKAITLVDEDQQAGYKKIIWDGRDRNGQPIASGIYFYRLKAGDTELVRKMSLIK
ncbi:MAG TPA: hypothetical protein DCZ43_02980 [candidate division Zixibacteria bacterium]|nr:hypothetical protein [candidate division Zixibacteria bacterium]